MIKSFLCLLARVLFTFVDSNFAELILPCYFPCTHIWNVFVFFELLPEIDVYYPYSSIPSKFCCQPHLLQSPLSPFYRRRVLQKGLGDFSFPHFPPQSN